MTVHVKTNEFSTAGDALAAQVFGRCYRCGRSLKYQVIAGRHLLECTRNRWHSGIRFAEGEQ